MKQKKQLDEAFERLKSAPDPDWENMERLVEQSIKREKVAKNWTSGFYITWFLIGSVLLVFPLWELIQLYRRQRGNDSSLTMSQFVVAYAKSGSRFFRVFILAFPVLISLVGPWLLFHWEGLCINFDLLCWIDV